MGHTFTNILMHVVFSTKDRVPALQGELKERVFAYMGGIVREMNGVPITINGPSDHVHLLAVQPATVALADFMRTLKTNSSRWVH